ncbi:MAG TPA: 4-(cytidine 5'-diphospho)-2-C-methyl-D-erythritol kinase [Acetobacteraceae bacterium]|jgi:4-diphosphocytidyl-2-C-methyl-D-erythritol kinase
MVAALVEAAPAKVNLYLHVVGRRQDGYHLLDSLVVFPGIGDVLRAAPDRVLSLHIDGPFGGVLRAEPDNLVLRAARALAAERGIEPAASLHLAKHLPVASGIGGGSADAAAALRLLARLWKVEGAGVALATGLGADVPVCLASRPVRMAGIGEIVSASPSMPDCGIVLVNPGIAVSTPAIFHARIAPFSPAPSLPAAWPDFAGFVSALAAMRNDLETPALALCPAIGDVLAALRSEPGCALARMSGSGATCFGLFPKADMAARAAAALRRPGWWSWGGSLMGVAERDAPT